MPACSARRSRKASVEFESVKMAMTIRKRLKLPSNSFKESLIFGCSMTVEISFVVYLTKKTMTNNPMTTGIEANRKTC